MLHCSSWSAIATSPAQSTLSDLLSHGFQSVIVLPGVGDTQVYIRVAKRVQRATVASETISERYLSGIEA